MIYENHSWVVQIALHIDRYFLAHKAGISRNQVTIGQCMLPVFIVSSSASMFPIASKSGPWLLAGRDGSWVHIHGLWIGLTLTGCNYSDCLFTYLVLSVNSEFGNLRASACVNQPFTYTRIRSCQQPANHNQPLVVHRVWLSNAARLCICGHQF